MKRRTVPGPGISLLARAVGPGQDGDGDVAWPACRGDDTMRSITMSLPVADEQHVYSGSFQDPDGHLWQVACA